MRPFLEALVFSCGIASLLGAQARRPVAPSEPLESSAWVAGVEEGLRRSEYRFSRQEPDAWSAPNRSHGLRSRVSAGGLEVFPRASDASGASAAWKLQARAASLGRGAEGRPLECRAPRASENRAERETGALVEWFVNDERGIEQGWTLAARPPGIGALWIGLEIDGLALRIDEGGHSGLFVDAAGVARLHYRDLRAFDANGTELEVRLEPTPSGVHVRVEDANALYPLMIDPLLTSPTWTAESDQTNAQFGVSAASAGDVNGDGYGDVIVGAYGYDNGQTNEGRAFVYLGSGAGLATSAAWTAESDQASAQFGRSVAPGGDVNGDGYGDVIVGAYLFDAGQTDEGRAFVYLGSASGLAASPAWTAEGNQANARFGSSVAAGGDVNGDGNTDVVVGAPSHDALVNPFSLGDEGRACLYLGSANGLSPSAAWTHDGAEELAGFGNSLASAGDVNGDGYSDVVVGESGAGYGSASEGRANLFLGSAGGLSGSPAWSVDGDEPFEAFGVSVSGAGDVNGDGYSDVIVGAIGHTNGQSREGGAFLYPGSASGLSLSPAWSAEGNQVEAQLGSAVAAAGDVNGDGFSDVIVGASLFDNGQTDEGRAFVYMGSSGGLATSASWMVESDQVGVGLDAWVSTAGDVNGDGYSDVVVGFPRYTAGQTSEGRVLAYQGSAAGLATTSAWSAEGGQVNARLGCSVACAGDVNGDGFSDVIVGAYDFDGGELDEGRALAYLGSSSGLAASPAWTAEGDQPGALFGWSVAGAGDVNGDGYGDVIVGAYLFDDGQTSEGRALAYLGSSSGLATSPSWTAEGDQAFAGLGHSVAGAGDVNGDGLGDVIVGVYRFDEGQVNEGQARVYLGSSSGLAPSPAWTTASDQAGAQFGDAVASAGDVNGDGYGDVLVGANWFDNGQSDEGRAFLYLGSAAGPAASPSWTAESDRALAQFGAALASAGDVNGDGYSDVLVGALFLANGHTNEGGAFAYLGSASGLATSPAWTVEGDQTDAQLGVSLASAGDVNGDGYSDVIVGAKEFDDGQSDEGAAFVYQGSASGLATSPAWTAECDQGSARFGVSVSAAGDANGDGYGDVLVGAYRFDDVHLDEGGAFLYLGNAGHGGRILAPTQRQVITTQPIAVLGQSEGLGFELHVEHPPLVGGGMAFLEWELKPLGGAFDGMGLERSTVGMPVDPFAALYFDDLVPVGSDLASPQKWRARIVLEGNTFFPSTPWFSLPGNARTETDLRFSGPRRSGLREF